MDRKMDLDATLPVLEVQGQTLHPGLRIGRYELIREIGRGGMGVVFLARDTHLARRVAVKFLVGASPQDVSRFLVEARATARCSHENIVVIHEVGEHDGTPYMVLEFLDGQPLSELMSGQALTVERALALIVPVVRALVKAHASDIVHRDLKPQNTMVTGAGVVKVLDFGLAKLRQQYPTGEVSISPTGEYEAVSVQTVQGTVMGTMPYMSPEQWGLDLVDHRTDIWAVGTMLYEMVTGEHLVAEKTAGALMRFAQSVDSPAPMASSRAPEVPPELDRIIDLCLKKRKNERYESAEALLHDLEALQQNRYRGPAPTAGDPYPGLSAFQESDAGHFFGRSREVQQLLARLRELPLVGLLGPSGVGKSSLVRAGLLTALRSLGEGWESLVLRPGRDPLSALAGIVQSFSSSSRGVQDSVNEHQRLIGRLRETPGYLGALLRGRCQQKSSRLLIFVDQFEELYTLDTPEADREAFIACLRGAADDATAPLRLVLALRSDFLHRVSESPAFMDELSRGLLFLRAPGTVDLREALLSPLELVGYRFEDPDMVDEMLESLQEGSGVLPLLQFAASQLWQSRDKERQVLTRSSYEAMGGIAGALASHADDVMGRLPLQGQRLLRAVFCRLVTANRTRALVEVSELRGLSDDPQKVDRLIGYLMDERLLVAEAQDQAESIQVEIIHESLIASWPTLGRWLDENPESQAFLQQLRVAAEHWHAGGRRAGRLWRGEAVEEARHFRRYYDGPLALHDQQYLDAVFAVADRSKRLKRLAVIGTIGLLLAVVVVGAAVTLEIRSAERRAAHNAHRAFQEARLARQAGARVKEQLQIVVREQQAAQKARSQAKSATGQLAVTNAKLREALDRAELARLQAEAAQRRAEAQSAVAARAVQAERKARAEAQRLAAERATRIRRLMKQRRKMATELR